MCCWFGRFLREIAPVQTGELVDGKFSITTGAIIRLPNPLDPRELLPAFRILNLEDVLTEEEITKEKRRRGSNDPLTARIEGKTIKGFHTAVLTDIVIESLDNSFSLSDVALEFEVDFGGDPTKGAFVVGKSTGSFVAPTSGDATDQKGNAFRVIPRGNGGPIEELKGKGIGPVAVEAFKTIVPFKAVAFGKRNEDYTSFGAIVQIDRIGFPGQQIRYVESIDVFTTNQVVPEPSSLVLWGIGGSLGLVGYKWRRRRPSWRRR